ncbi:MAG: DNA repair protein RecN [Microthrixaceae bacterium]
MLVELAVRNLGVIVESRIPLAAGMTALTGETGAGKTMVVEALRLLGGAKADSSRVREGAGEAVVEALFALGDTEWVLRRVVPASGRSRSYVNGELVTAGELAELSGGLMEIHGQHSQQSLLDRSHQRAALDRFAGVDTAPLGTLRRTVASLEEQLAELGGDERARQRELDLLAHQVAEIEAAAPEPGEEELLESEEDLLAGALGYREAAEGALEVLGTEGGAADLLARGSAMLGSEGPFSESTQRLVGLKEELLDALADLRAAAEAVEPDEERLAEVRARRQLLVELRRKYGDSIPEVLEFLDRTRTALGELQAVGARREEVGAELSVARERLGVEAERVGAARSAAAPQLAGALEEALADLALGAVSVEVCVQQTAELPGAAEAVEIRISTNPGMSPGPLSKVASGGELSRVMLALRLVLSGGPPVMVFDEVDAGIGGEAALRVGEALASVASSRQVLVVTHLPQVAAFADAQVLVHKEVRGGAAQHRSGAAQLSTSTTAIPLDAGERVVELSRMLSGDPESGAARAHAEELLERASRSHPQRSGSGNLAGPG